MVSMGIMKATAVADANAPKPKDTSPEGEVPSSDSCKRLSCWKNIHVNLERHREWKSECSCVRT